MEILYLVSSFFVFLLFVDRGFVFVGVSVGFGRVGRWGLGLERRGFGFEVLGLSLVVFFIVRVRGLDLVFVLGKGRELDVGGSVVSVVK